MSDVGWFIATTSTGTNLGRWICSFHYATMQALCDPAEYLLDMLCCCVISQTLLTAHALSTAAD